MEQILLCGIAQRAANEGHWHEALALLDDLEQSNSNEAASPLGDALGKYLALASQSHSATVDVAVQPPTSDAAQDTFVASVPSHIRMVVRDDFDEALILDQRSLTLTAINGSALAAWKILTEHARTLSDAHALYAARFGDSAGDASRDHLEKFIERVAGSGWLVLRGDTPITSHSRSCSIDSR